MLRNLLLKSTKKTNQSTSATALAKATTKIISVQFASLTQLTQYLFLAVTGVSARNAP